MNYQYRPINDPRDWLNVAEATESLTEETADELERVLQQSLVTNGDAAWLWEMRNLSLTAQAFDRF